MEASCSSDNAQELANSAIEENVDEGTEEVEKDCLARLPMARIKRIMRADPDMNMAKIDAVFLIAKATELFVENLTKEAYKKTMSSRRKTISRDDIELATENIDSLAFLDGAMDWD